MCYQFGARGKLLFLLHIVLYKYFFAKLTVYQYMNVKGFIIWHHLVKQDISHLESGINSSVKGIKHRIYPIIHYNRLPGIA